MDIGLTDQASAHRISAGRSLFREHMRRFTQWSRRHPRLAWVTAAAVVCLVLFWCYLRQAQTYQLNVDPAGQALQAWDMLHGNLLLRGWWLGDVSFYTVELPLNMIIEMIVGLRPVEISILAALIYTAVVLLTALLAKGSARGREGVVRALLGGGILLAPSLVLGTRVLMQGPDHLGTAVPILLALLVLDRAPERWWVPVVVGVLLTLAQVSDVLATFAGAAAVAVACGVRVGLEIVRHQRPLKSAGYDLCLGLAAVISIGLAHLVLWGINAAGGFYMRPPKYGLGLAPISALPAHAGDTVYNLLILFGADFFGQHTVVGVVLALLHLTGVALALCGLLIGLAGFFGRAADRVTQVLVAGTVIILAAGIVRQLHVRDRRRPRDRHRAAVLRGARRPAPRRRSGQGEAGATARRWARLLPRSARLQRHPAGPGSVARGSGGLAGSSPSDDRPGTVLGIEHHLAR